LVELVDALTVQGYYYAVLNAEQVGLALVELRDMLEAAEDEEADAA
jgi:hypothetical protein